MRRLIKSGRVRVEISWNCARLLKHGQLSTWTEEVLQRRYREWGWHKPWRCVCPG